MVDVIKTGLVVVVLALFGVALIAMSAGNYAFAGMSFLGASIALYYRETR